jgi:hypothetical protein
MDVSLDGIELDETRSVGIEESAPAASPASPSPVTDIALDAIEETDQPKPNDRLDPEQITPPPAQAETIKKVANRTFPNPAVDGLMAAIRKEAIAAAQIAEREKMTNEYMKKIDQLLELNTSLAALKDKDDKVSFTDDIKKHLEDLKAQGIDLWKDQKTTDITKEKLDELKLNISRYSDESNTKMKLLLNKMQSLVQDLMAILEAAKGIVGQNRNLLGTINRNSRVGS